MARWEVTYEGPMRPNIDATVRRLRLFRDGQDVGALDVVLVGPEVEAIARGRPEEPEEARRLVRRAVVWAGARSLDGTEVTRDETVRQVPVDPRKVLALVESDEQLPDPEEAAVLHSGDER